MSGAHQCARKFVCNDAINLEFELLYICSRLSHSHDEPSVQWSNFIRVGANLVPDRTELNFDFPPLRGSGAITESVLDLVSESAAVDFGLRKRSCFTACRVCNDAQLHDVLYFEIECPSRSLNAFSEPGREANETCGQLGPGDFGRLICHNCILSNTNIRISVGISIDLEKKALQVGSPAIDGFHMRDLICEGHSVYVLGV